jgi:hypothetical protein
MTTETEVKEIKPDFTEMVSVEGDPIGRVLKATYVKTRNGPPEKEEAGRIGIFTKTTALDLVFSGRVSLLELEGEKTYKCIRKFQFTNAKGEYEIIEPKTELELNDQEAVRYIQGGVVVPAFTTSLWGVYHEDS